jgi:hypothetical protein
MKCCLLRKIVDRQDKMRGNRRSERARRVVRFFTNYHQVPTESSNLLIAGYQIESVPIKLTEPHGTPCTLLSLFPESEISDSFLYRSLAPTLSKSYRLER